MIQSQLQTSCTNVLLDGICTEYKLGARAFSVTRKQFHGSALRACRINSLPCEIISIIFVMATHSSYNHPDLSVAIPVLLSHVCSCWRQVALSTTELWTTILLIDPLTPSSLRRIAAFLHRSQNRPLELKLDFRDPYWDWTEDSHKFSARDMGDILRLLLPHVSRWRFVELLTDTWAPICSFLLHTRCAGPAPLLEDISLSRCNAYFALKGQEFLPVDLKSPIPLFGGGLPSLRSVMLAGVHVDWSNSSLRDLQELGLKYHAQDVTPSLHEFVKILADCPRLERLSIVGWGPQLENENISSSSNAHIVVPVIELSHLTCLEIGFLDVDYAIKLLSLFRLPSLLEISLQDLEAALDPMSDQDSSSVLDYLCRPSSSVASHSDPMDPTPYYNLSCVQSLKLVAVRSSEASLSRFLRVFTQLQRLSVECMEGHGLRVLSPPYSDHHSVPSVVETMPCPNLTELKCRRVNFPVLIETIISRSATDYAAQHPLGSVTIDLSGDGSGFEVDMDLYETLAAVGIKLQVLSDNESDCSRRGSLASIEVETNPSLVSHPASTLVSVSYE